MFAPFKCFSTMRECHENTGRFSDQFEQGRPPFHLENLYIVGMPVLKKRMILYMHEDSQIQIFTKLASPTFGQLDLPLVFT